jgi:hypothetical protein
MADTASDLKILNDLPRDRKYAWAGFFNGARCHMKVFEGEDRMFFGKYECEKVPTTFWTEELVALGWVTIEDGPKRPALGMADLPEGRKPWCWERTIQVTDRGWAVREADIEDFRRVMRERG